MRAAEPVDKSCLSRTLPSFRPKYLQVAC
ncbi:MucR family transcriptional regulator, partial [Sinorhizobium meliloti]